METSISSVRALLDYNLEVTFQNGSKANVNFKSLIKTMRFSKLRSPEMFLSARTEGDKIIWSDNNQTMQIYCNEIPDLLMR